MIRTSICLSMISATSASITGRTILGPSRVIVATTSDWSRPLSTNRRLPRSSGVSP
jgi:hypothetical protein